jgi:hypothetical protein
MTNGKDPQTANRREHATNPIAVSDLSSGTTCWVFDDARTGLKQEAFV